MNDKWYQHYVTFFTIPRKFPLPKPIPQRIKNYLRGTFKQFWTRTLLVMCSIFTFLYAFFILSVGVSGHLTGEILLHSGGTISVIAGVCFTAWSIAYYSHTRLTVVKDLRYILRSLRK